MSSDQSFQICSHQFIISKIAKHTALIAKRSLLEKKYDNKFKFSSASSTYTSLKFSHKLTSLFTWNLQHHEIKNNGKHIRQ